MGWWDLPASTLSSSPFCFLFFVFGYRPLGTGTTSAAGERWQMNIEMCRWSFCAENVRERARKTEGKTERERRFYYIV